MTPHLFRAGMATDLEVANVPRARIKKIGRWHSDRAMEQYIRSGLAKRLRQLSFYFVLDDGDNVGRRDTKAAIVSHYVGVSDSSEGYDDSE